jgi:CubicO group peptidase (beta-lactamase class C family)
MKKTFFIYLIFSVSFLFAQEKDMYSLSTLPLISAEDTLEYEITKLFNKGHFHGLSVAIVSDTGFVYNQQFGYSDTEKKELYNNKTLQPIASISKLFIGVSLLKAQDLGYLNINDPINKYLPFKVYNPNHPEVEITIKQLTNHTSSIKGNKIDEAYTFIANDTIIQTNSYFKEHLHQPNYHQNLETYLTKLLTPQSEYYNPKLFSKKAPGEKMNYSNIGSALCALIIERASNQDFHSFCQKHILDELGMTNSGWFAKDIDTNKLSILYHKKISVPQYHMLCNPAGGFITSSTDLGKFLMELINGYSSKGKLLKPESYDLLFDKQNKSMSNHHGVFAGIHPKHNNIGHLGGNVGVNTRLTFNTELNTGIIILINTDFSLLSQFTYVKLFDTLIKYQEQTLK